MSLTHHQSFLYKKGADGEKIESATLRDAQFEVQYYEEGFNSPESAYNSGRLAATFTFATKSTNKANLGTQIFRNMAEAKDYDYGIDFTPRLGEDGKPLKDDDGRYSIYGKFLHHHFLFPQSSRPAHL